MSDIKHASEQTFQALCADHQGLVLVDFHANWCGPCKAMSPALEAFAKAHPEVQVIKVDVDTSPALASAHRVRGIPTLQFIRDGQVLGTKVGAQTRAQLDQFHYDVLAG